MSGWRGGVLGLGLTLLACTSTRVPDPGGDCHYPAAPDGFDGPVHHVCGTAAGCEDGREGSGTAEAPHCTVGSALEAAPPGPAAVLVAAGEYPERVVVERGDLLLLGPGGAQRAVIRPPAGLEGMIIVGATEVSVRGVVVADAAGTGVRVSRARARLEDLTVEGVVPAGEGMAFGAVVDDGATAELVGVRIREPAGLGLLVDESTATLEGSVVSGATAGGVRLQRTTRPVVIRDSEIADCTLYGVGLYSADARLEGGAIRGTRRSPDGTGGDAVVVAALTGSTAAGRLEMERVRVTGSGRLGGPAGHGRRCPAGGERHRGQ